MVDLTNTKLQNLRKACTWPVQFSPATSSSSDFPERVQQPVVGWAFRARDQKDYLIIWRQRRNNTLFN